MFFSPRLSNFLSKILNTNDIITQLNSKDLNFVWIALRVYYYPVIWFLLFQKQTKKNCVVLIFCKIFRVSCSLTAFKNRVRDPIYSYHYQGYIYKIHKWNILDTFQGSSSLPYFLGLAFGSPIKYSVNIVYTIFVLS